MSVKFALSVIIATLLCIAIATPFCLLVSGILELFNIDLPNELDFLIGFFIGVITVVIFWYPFQEKIEDILGDC